MRNSTFSLLRFALLVSLLGALLAFVGCTTTTKVPKLCNDDSECASGEICLSSRCTSTSKECDGGACKDGGDGQDGKTNPDTPACSNPPCKTDENPSDDKKEVVADGGPNEPVKDGDVHDTHPDTPPKDDDQPKICSPNRDGILQRNEVLFKLGTSVIYARSGSSSSTVEVDLKGTQKDGSTFWDFSKEPSGTTREVDELLSLKGLWYANDYKDASYASILDRTLNLYGVYKATPGALLLMGAASRTKNQVKTSYDKPIEVLKFPLKVGSTWTSTGTSSGTFNFAPYRATETYKFEADAKGKLKTKNGTYDVIRLRLNFTQQQYLPALYRRTRISYFYAAECYGFVAIVDSRDYETNANFTKAVRLKRLSD
jgi:hypothetical protein